MSSTTAAVFIISCICISITSSIKTHKLNNAPGIPEDCSECGARMKIAPKFVPYMVNGKSVHDANTYPWMVALMHKDNGTKFCGGAIISNRFILTAAHCTVKDNLKYKIQESFESNEIQIGFISDTDDLEPGPDVERIIPHPLYKTRCFILYDIALIKLKEEITCGAHRNPICLPPYRASLDPGSRLIIAGWGAVDGKTRTYIKELQEAKVKVANASVCKDFFSSTHAGRIYCMMSDDNQVPCYGDSGGPMFLERNGRFYTMGVASGCDKHCKTEEPFTYSPVAKEIGWIRQVTGVSPRTGF